MWKNIKKLNPVSRSSRNSRLVFSPTPTERDEERDTVMPSPPRLSPPPRPSSRETREFTISQSSLLYYAGTPHCYIIHLKVGSLDSVDIAHNLPKCFALGQLVPGINRGSAFVKLAYLPVKNQQIVSSEPLFVKFTNKVLPVSTDNPMTVHINIMESAESTDPVHVIIRELEDLEQALEPKTKKRQSARHDPLECLVCYMVFTDENGTRAPLVLRCGHTLCEECAKSLYNSTLKTIHCPLDRTPTRGPTAQISKNFAILDVLQERKGEQDYQSIDAWNLNPPRRTPLCENPDVPCYESPMHESTCYCNECKVTFCENCYIRTHSSKILSNHKFVKVDERPIDFPNCYFHKTVPAEFVCMKESCRNEPKICCKTCIQTIHHNHTPYMRTKNFVEHNVASLNAIVNKLKISEVETIMTIRKADEFGDRLSKTHESYVELVSSINTFYDQKKENAVKKLDNIMTLKKRLFDNEKNDVTAELEKISETRNEIEKELRKKNVLVGVERLKMKGEEVCSVEVRQRAAFLPFVYPKLHELTAPPTPPVRGSTLEGTVQELRSISNADIYARPDQN